MHRSTAPEHPAPPQATAARNASPWLMPVIALVQLMLILDITVANVALPDLAAELALGPGLTPWVVTAYVLALGGFLLVGGRVSDVVGSRRVLLLGLAAFTVASAVAATAQSGPALVAARAAQGLSAAFVSPSALATLTTAYTGAARHRALVVCGAIGGAGVSVGVIVGGLLVSGPGWRWIFLINLPIGVLVMAGVARLVPARQEAPDASTRRVDLLGGLLVTAATGALIYALTRIGQDRSVTAVGVAFLAVAGLGYAAFLAHQRRTQDPLVDPRLLRTPRVATGALIMLASSAILVGLFFVLSFYDQRGLGWSALQTGLSFLPLAAGTVVGAHLGSTAVRAHGPRAVAPVAFAVAAVGLGLAAWQVDSTPLLLVATGLTAVGLGAGFVTATTTALGDADEGRAGVVSGIVNTAHELGAAVGVAALSGIVTASAATALADSVVAGLVGLAVTALVIAVIGALAIPAGRPAEGVAVRLH
ncbi:MFS transporter [Intrasporangium oryzae NRRL B-24470]|uniref:MFS transporter n=1 Tax=Intrasporangium oryzae NRRL B-24470 TaxID=1386089 RepID=W9G2K9_9MICO|nr:MFS transporter [Intrasporangium oryzae]EWT00235.1 MFS transporter [Intrasporangium oryzae NRRL B-24470]